jgi:hypothetical protein
MYLKSEVCVLFSSLSSRIYKPSEALRGGKCLVTSLMLSEKGHRNKNTTSFIRARHELIQTFPLCFPKRVIAALTKRTYTYQEKHKKEWRKIPFNHINTIKQSYFPESQSFYLTKKKESIKVIKYVWRKQNKKALKSYLKF